MRDSKLSIKPASSFSLFSVFILASARHSLHGIRKSIFVVHTNEVYYKLFEDRAWLPTKVLDTWYITRYVKRWHRVLDARWQSHLQFRAKVFLWRAIVGGLPLAMALKQRHISNGTCFFCMVVKEDARHRFITCPVAKAIWVFYYLRYWGMWFNWTMRNGFLFDGLHGVTQQLRRMKREVDLAIFTTMLYGDVSQEEVDLCHLVVQHLRGFPLHYHYL